MKRLCRNLLGPAFLIALCLVSRPHLADHVPDKYPGSALYAKPQEVAPGVWSAIGATQPPSYENSGHNNNLSFVIGETGVPVVNGGAAFVLSEALHERIKAITDKPVLYVVDENGQGHAMLGNSYWRDKVGALIEAGGSLKCQRRRKTVPLRHSEELVLEVHGRDLWALGFKRMPLGRLNFR